jgi:eukaryotic-like serine/threonine-protein kinase
MGPYEILAPIGAGGMGEVYQARDTRLERIVAIKVLAAALTADPRFRERFDREARVISRFNHPNICTLHDVGDHAGSGYLVLELLEGETLTERLARARGRGLPMPEALALAVQIADALEAAHEKGIVHRDLKPGNIKITPGGVAKVLDFGLATYEASGASADEIPASADQPTQTPTLMNSRTQSGTILGTVGYMSPEQARGLPVDKRTDIWAFGCVLHEMLTGRAPFKGETNSDALAVILESDPDWNRLPPATPPSVRRLLERCLAKDPRQRLRDVGDARLELSEALASPATAPPDTSRHAKARLGAGWIAALTAAAAIVTGVVVWNLKPRVTPAQPGAGSVARLVVAPAPTAPLAVNASPIALSPDGRRIAFVAGSGSRQQIYVQDLDQFSSTPVAGTEGGGGPFFSPDGQWLGFFADGKLKKVLRSGGAPLTITEEATVTGIAEARWEADGTILYTPTLGAGVWRVSSIGGTPTAITKLVETDGGHRWPQLLPGGKELLFSVTGSRDAQAYAQSLDTGKRRPLVKGSGVTYLPTGHLVYVQAGTLMAVPFDPVRLEVTGMPVVVLSGIREMTRLRNSTVANLVPQVAFSNAGTLAYVPASPASGQHALTWVDHSGIERPSGASGGTYFQPRISPDGRRVAVTVRGEHDDVWLYDLTRETWNRFTSDGNNAFPVWTPDGRRLTFVSDKAGLDNMYWKTPYGGREERLLVSDQPNYPFSWSRDGTLMFVAPSVRGAQDILMLRADQNPKPTAFLATPFAEGAPTFSPDGRWLAYVSNDSGRNQVYVRPYPGPGESLTISTEGGNEPVWAKSGRELFYRSGDAMMAVDFTSTPTLAIGKPRRLFEGPYELSSSLWPDYDVAADGRFLMVKPINRNETPAQIYVVLNWFEELKRLAPTPLSGQP